MIEKGIIKERYHESSEFVSPILINHKQDRGIRLIISLKKLNKYVKYEYFKMDNIKSVLNLVTPKLLYVYNWSQRCILYCKNKCRVSMLFKISVERKIVKVYMLP